MKCQSSFDLFRPFKNVKSILTLQALQKSGGDLGGSQTPCDRKIDSAYQPQSLPTFLYLSTLYFCF